MDLLTNQSQSYNFFLIKEAVLLVDLSLFFSAEDFISHLDFIGGC